MNRSRILTSFCQRLLLLCVVLLGPPVIQAGDFPTADKVVIEKAARALHLLRDGEIFRTFNISLGMMPVGDKGMSNRRKATTPWTGAIRPATIFFPVAFPIRIAMTCWKRGSRALVLAVRS